MSQEPANIFCNYKSNDFVALYSISDVFFRKKKIQKREDKI